MNTELIQRAHTMIEATLWAAVLASPLDPGLDDHELSEAIQAAWPDIGPGSVNTALASNVGGRDRDESHRLVASALTWALLLVDVDSAPEEVFPRSTVIALASVFDAAENQHGVGVAIDIDTLAARARISRSSIELAVGSLCSLGWLACGASGFKRRTPWPKLKPSTARPDLSIDEFQKRGVAAILKVKPFVADVIRRRTGQHAPTTKPTTRFADYLMATGWTGLHGWWSETSREMQALDLSNPSAICVLCAALLEAALVAVAIPARDAGEWRQKFLTDQTPAEWKLGKLIDQAETAKMFSPAQKALAETMMNSRNRIHAGKFATPDGKLSPPYTNEHEARQARDQLDTLLTALLDSSFIKTRLAASP